MYIFKISVTNKSLELFYVNISKIKDSILQKQFLTKKCFLFFFAIVSTACIKTKYSVVQYTILYIHSVCKLLFIGKLIGI